MLRVQAFPDGKLLALLAGLAAVPVFAKAATLVAHYTFDDGTAADSSGNGYNGTAIGN